MCGRYVLKREDLEALVKQFGVRSLEEFHSRYNIAPSAVVPLLRSPKGDTIEVAAVRWGLVPAWTKPDVPLKPLVNLRAETLVARFRGALRGRRCVLPASGFYEWQKVGARRQPWFFARRDGGPFGLAGIWDTWRGREGVELETCAIITTTPNSVLQPIHDRMPVMLAPDQCRAWLAEGAAHPEAAKALLASAPDELMLATKVGPAVSNVRNDGPECIEAAGDEPGDAEPQLSLGW